jgi:hypothetical protein
LPNEMKFGLVRLLYAMMARLTVASDDLIISRQRDVNAGTRLRLRAERRANEIIRWRKNQLIRLLAAANAAGYASAPQSFEGIARAYGILTALSNRAAVRFAAATPTYQR